MTASEIKAEIILRSSNKATGDIITTYKLTMPRIILAELNTHRIFTRNVSSSRAIPIKKMLDRVRNNPFVPGYWGANQKGMSAQSELEGIQLLSAKVLWQVGTWGNIQLSRAFAFLGLHKQLGNRVTEPFQNIEVVLTSTCMKNFFNLRNSSSAQPEIRALAQALLAVEYTNYPYRELEAGEWHLPLIRDEEYLQYQEGILSLKDILYVSLARAARVSYFLPNSQSISSLDKDLGLGRRLYESGHLSPFEHPAIALPERYMVGNFTGFGQMRKFLYKDTIDQDDDSIVAILTPTEFRRKCDPKLLQLLNA